MTEGSHAHRNADGDDNGESSVIRMWRRGAQSIANADDLRANLTLLDTEHAKRTLASSRSAAVQHWDCPMSPVNPSLALGRDLEDLKTQS